MQNQRDQYAAVDGSYTPDWIFSLMMWITSPKVEDGIGMLR
jgi:hypothetical protein